MDEEERYTNEMKRERSKDGPADDPIERPDPITKDYYFTEDGCLVFTEQYHLRRGSCCGNQCRHCPYGHEAVKKAGG